MKLSQMTLVVLSLVLLASGVPAFAWGPVSHQKMALNALSHPTIAPYIQQYGLSTAQIINASWELDLPQYKDEYHNPGWQTIRDRLWLTDPKWASLSENRRIGFLIHLASDSGVPINHSPSGSVFKNTTVEGLLEARVETWGDFPSITPYTGTYTQKMNSFYSQQMALANWCKNNLKWYNVLGSKGKTAGWSGLTYGQNLTQAMLLEYFQTRDQIEMLAVPEPTTIALLSIGAIALWRRRRR